MHVAAQHRVCPICSSDVDFRIFPRVGEGMADDVKYLARKFGLSFLNEETRANAHSRDRGGSDVEHALRLWGRVGRETRRELVEAYKEDFELFGYSAEEYFRELGV